MYEVQSTKYDLCEVRALKNSASVRRKKMCLCFLVVLSSSNLVRLIRKQNLVLFRSRLLFGKRINQSFQDFGLHLFAATQIYEKIF